MFVASFNCAATEFTSVATISPSISIAGPLAPPNPPNMTDINDRFIALHIMYERIAPDEPTKAPVTISKSFPSKKPVAAAAQPE